MGCGVSSLLLKCIGLPLEIPFKAKSIWDGVIERIECRLAGWNYLLSFSKLFLFFIFISNVYIKKREVPPSTQESIPRNQTRAQKTHPKTQRRPNPNCPKRATAKRQPKKEPKKQGRTKTSCL
jgi:hypothetical protein